MVDGGEVEGHERRIEWKAGAGGRAVLESERLVGAGGDRPHILRVVAHGCVPVGARPPSIWTLGPMSTGRGDGRVLEWKTARGQRSCDQHAPLTPSRFSRLRRCAARVPVRSRSSWSRESCGPCTSCHTPSPPSAPEHQPSACADREREGAARGTRDALRGARLHEVDLLRHRTDARAPSRGPHALDCGRADYGWLTTHVLAATAESPAIRKSIASATGSAIALARERECAPSPGDFVSIGQAHILRVGSAPPAS